MATLTITAGVMLQLEAVLCCDVGLNDLEKVREAPQST